MIFRRKKREQAPQAEMRREYRRVPGKKHALGVKLAASNQPPVAGELVDLSAGGVGVLFPGGRDPGLDPGQEVLLSFSSLMHGGEVVAEALARSSWDGDEGGRRYGFEFTDRERLFAQLDAYYFKFFNRRRAMRVRPALDRKLTATLAIESDSMEVSIHNISPDGFGVVVAPEKAGMLEGAEDLTCTFAVPKTASQERAAGVWLARAVHLSPLPQGLVFGAVFLIPEDPEVIARRQALAEYCAERSAEMALWDTPSGERT